MTVSVKRTLCLDFDGVVHSYTSGWKGPRTIPDPPVKGAIRFIYHALNIGWDVVIYSTRSSHWFGRWAMRRWLRNHSIKYLGSSDYWNDYALDLGLESVRFARVKPSAFVTLDDRALTFTGEWPTLADLEAFKPWNKK